MLLLVRAHFDPSSDPDPFWPQDISTPDGDSVVIFYNVICQVTCREDMSESWESNYVYFMTCRKVK